MNTVTLTPAGIESFWAQVDKSGDCWEWQGSYVSGYGRVVSKRDAKGKRKTVRAHRAAYELMVGPIPDGMMLDHICHNRSCVNPRHLRPVTNKQNCENLSGPHADSTSGYRGVHWKSREQRWMVAVVHNGVHHYGGYFTDRDEAAKVAQTLRRKLFTHSDMDNV